MAVDRIHLQWYVKRVIEVHVPVQVAHMYRVRATHMDQVFVVHSSPSFLNFSLLHTYSTYIHIYTYINM